MAFVLNFSFRVINMVNLQTDGRIFNDNTHNMCIVIKNIAHKRL